MLLEIPADVFPAGTKLTCQLGMRLCFSDPMACMIFQRERIEDLLIGHNWRLFAARGMERERAMAEAVRDGFQRVVIYGLGSTGLLGAIAIKEAYPEARIVTVARSAAGGDKDSFLTRHWKGIHYLQASSDPAQTARAIIEALGGKPRVFLGTSGNAIEAELAFTQELLDNNGIYASFSLGPAISYDSMPFGFKNHLIFGAINFRRDHMEEAIRMLCKLPLDELVREYPLADLTNDPIAFYQTIYRAKDRAFKSACVWDPERIE
jgi:threonine dehydrogenase-like Zn-dependent dehydrogenase